MAGTQPRPRYPLAGSGAWAAGRAHPSAAERLRLADGTPPLCGRSRTTSVHPDLADYAGYGHDTSHHCFYWGSRLLLVTTCEGTVTSFGLANPKLSGEREHARLLLSTRPANRPPKGSAVVTDKGLSGIEEFFCWAGLCLVHPPRASVPDRL